MGGGSGCRKRSRKVDKIGKANTDIDNIHDDDNDDADNDDSDDDNGDSKDDDDLGGTSSKYLPTDKKTDRGQQLQLRPGKMGRC